MIATLDIGEDALLGGRVRLRQPKSGYRVAIDPVFLAAAVPAEKDERVLDVGCGVGAAALCLAARAPRVRVLGFDWDADLVSLATENAIANGVGSRVSFMAGTVGPGRVGPPADGFDHVMTNPPFGEPGRGTSSPSAAKRAATVEGAVDLKAWLDFCLDRTRPRGTVTVIHRADRLDAIFAAFAGRAGDAAIFPLWPGPDAKPAKRVLVRARKGTAGPLHLLPGLVLHQADGAYTEAAEAVLRHGRALAI